MTKIYTKTGDKGTSGLIGGTRVSKDDIRLDAYGSLDELNAILGLVISELHDKHDAEYVQLIQHQLFRLGSSLATDKTVKDPHFKEPVTEDRLHRMEQEIDDLLSKLPEQDRFILPGGNKSASLCHVARTVCRRTERLTVKVSKIHDVDEGIIVYLNRLSDYLYCLARKACLFDSQEIFWDPAK
jgi:cob(I)alamin adenosyltransferase